MAREDGDPTWYTRADALFGHALALAPRDFTALAGRGSLALSRHDFAGGLALGRRALAIDPSSPYAMGVVVDANVELGRYPRRSERHRAPACASGPTSRRTRARSYYLELHGRTGAARQALVQATQSGAPSGENTAWAYLYLGNLEFNHGRYAAAEAQLPDRAPHLSGVRARPGRPGEAGGRPRAVRAGRSPATRPSSSGTRSRRT